MNILFLCTGNSCRSQMAEAWGKALNREDLNFFSAGVSPQEVNKNAILVMGEVGIDLSENRSTHIDEVEEDIDIVFTVCGGAKEACVFYRGERVIHVGFDDPPELTKHLTDQNEILKVYRRVRDEIKSFVGAIDQYIGGDI